jgi:DNA-binding NarL/FixJ family response regulator
MATIRILVVDDHKETRKQIIKELRVGNLLEIVGEAETSDEALKLAEKLLPDIVLLDLHLPGLISLQDLIKRLVALRNVKVALFANPVKAEQVKDLLEAGAASYSAKEDTPALIRMTLLMVARGSRNLISPSLPRQLLNISQLEKNILSELAKKGKLEKVLERLGISGESLAKSIEELRVKLEFEDSASMARWAKKNGF